MQATAEALADLAEYKSIIVDLPPLTSDTSFREAAGLLDAVDRVADWGKTPVEMLSELVGAAGCPAIAVSPNPDVPRQSKLRRSSRSDNDRDQTGC